MSVLDGFGIELIIVYFANGYGNVVVVEFGEMLS